MHITPAMLKKYSVYSFLNRSNLAFVSFQKKKFTSKNVNVMFMFRSCCLLEQGTFNVFAYLLILHDFDTIAFSFSYINECE